VRARHTTFRYLCHGSPHITRTNTRVRSVFRASKARGASRPRAGVNISHGVCGPPTISDRCLWPDTILRRTPIFLPGRAVTFIPRILINFDLGQRRAPTCARRSRPAAAARDTIVSLKSMMRPMTFNESKEMCVPDISRWEGR